MVFMQKLAVDDGPSVAQSQVVGGEEEDKSTCPPLELAAIVINAVGNAVLSFFRPFFLRTLDSVWSELVQYDRTVERVENVALFAQIFLLRGYFCMTWQPIRAEVRL